MSQPQTQVKTRPGGLFSWLEDNANIVLIIGGLVGFGVLAYVLWRRSIKEVTPK